jgi:hypothetical protein
MDGDELGDGGGVVGGVELRAGGGERHWRCRTARPDRARRAGGAAVAARAGAGRRASCGGRALGMGRAGGGESWWRASE